MLNRTEYRFLEVQLLKSLNRLDESEDLSFEPVLSSSDLFEILTKGQKLLGKYNMDWHCARDALTYFGDKESMPTMHLLFKYRLVELGYILSEAILDVVQKIVAIETKRNDLSPSEKLLITQLGRQIPQYAGEKPGQLHYMLELPVEPETEILQQCSKEEYAYFQQRYKIDANALGNTSLTSDYDITIFIPEFPEYEIDIVIRFNDLFREKFKNREAGVVFDTNVYNGAFLSLQKPSASDGETASYASDSHNQNYPSLLNSKNESSSNNDCGMQYSFLSIRQCFATNATGTVVGNDQWNTFKGQIIEEIKTQVTNNQAFKDSVQSQGKNIEEVFTLANKKVETIFNKANQLYQTIEEEKHQAVEKLACAIEATPDQLNVHQKMRAANDLFEAELCRVKQFILMQYKQNNITRSSYLNKINSGENKPVDPIPFFNADNNSNLRASFNVKNTVNSAYHQPARQQEAYSTISPQVKTLAKPENNQWIEVQCRALAFANEAYFSEGAVRNMLKHSQKNTLQPDTYNRHHLFQSMLMDIGYKIKNLRQSQENETIAQSSYVKINAITTAKYGVRVSRSCHSCNQLSNESFLFTTLYQSAYQRVQSILDQEITYQSICDKYRSKPYRILSQNEIKRRSVVQGTIKQSTSDSTSIAEMLDQFDPNKTLSDFIRLAAVLSTPFILTDYTD